MPNTSTIYCIFAEPEKSLTFNYLRLIQRQVSKNLEQHLFSSINFP